MAGKNQDGILLCKTYKSRAYSKMRVGKKKRDAMLCRKSYVKLNTCLKDIVLISIALVKAVRPL